MDASLQVKLEMVIFPKLNKTGINLILVDNF
jgi:hypothetical protein